MFFEQKLLLNTSHSKFGSNNEIETRIDAPVVQSNSTSENHDIKTIFDKAAARVCEKCYKTRILDFRAAEKFPLGLLVKIVMALKWVKIIFKMIH